jgi:hypothetical protein
VEELSRITRCLSKHRVQSLRPSPRRSRCWSAEGRIETQQSGISILRSLSTGHPALQTEIGNLCPRLAEGLVDEKNSFFSAKIWEKREIMGHIQQIYCRSDPQKASVPLILMKTGTNWLNSDNGSQVHDCQDPAGVQRCLSRQDSSPGSILTRKTTSHPRKAQPLLCSESKNQRLPSGLKCAPHLRGVIPQWGEGVSQPQ